MSQTSQTGEGFNPTNWIAYLSLGYFSFEVGGSLVDSMTIEVRPWKVVDGEYRFLSSSRTVSFDRCAARIHSLGSANSWGDRFKSQVGGSDALDEGHKTPVNLLLGRDILIKRPQRATSGQSHIAWVFLS